MLSFSATFFLHEKKVIYHANFRLELLKKSIKFASIYPQNLTLMDTYNYSPNGIDYDPDLLYDGANESSNRRKPRNTQGNDSRNNDRNSDRSADRGRGYDDYNPENERNSQPTRRQRRRTTSNYDAVAAREEMAARDRQRRDRENERRYEQALQRERAEKERRNEIAAEKAAERKIRDAERAAEKARRAADREAAKTARKPFSESGFVKFFKDKRTHAFFGVVLLCVAAYILIAAISFMRSGSADQSAVGSITPDQISAGTAKGKIENTGGPIGAIVAQLIFAQGLGIGSLTSIVYLVLLGLGLMGIKKCNFWSVTFKSLLVAVAVSIVAGFIAKWSGSDFMLGGVHGQYVNDLLVNSVDWIGAALVSIILIAAVVYLYLNDFISFYKRYRSFQKARKAKAEQIKLEREEAQAKVIAAMQQSDLNDIPQEETPSQEDREERREAVADGFNDDFGEVTDEYAITPDDDPYRRSYDEQDGAPAEDTPVNDNTHNTAPQEPDTNVRFMPEQEVITDVPTAHDVPVATDDQTTDGGQQFPGQQIPTQQFPAVAEGGQPAEPEKPQEEAGPTFDVISNKIEIADPSRVGADTMYDPTAELSHYQRPGIDLLNEVKAPEESYDVLEQEANKERIIKALEQFEIQINKIEATVGPTVTLYEIVPAEGTRIAKIKRLEDDIAMTLAAKGIRIIAPIPGRGTIGIEVPNHDAQTVSIRSILSSKAFQESKCELPMAMGATISNEVYIADLASMPHILVAGATGQGKSVGLNTIIASLLYKKHPAELKFVLIDPKRVEFSLYNALENHFLAKLPDEDEAIVTNMDNVVKTLNSLCVEMEKRYDLLKDAKVVKVTKYNELFIQKKLNPEKGHRYLPYIVIIVDEFADLIMTAGKQVETPIARIAQMARAVGMHMIIATQRPSTNVITGLIKANFPGRIAFRVTQMVDSRTILDCPGANQLIGKGDMLFSHNGVMERVQCAYIDTKEVQRICNFIEHQPGFIEPYYLPEPLLDDNDSTVSGRNGNLSDRDPLFEEAAQIIVQTGVASTSSLQRRYSIGYNRAGKIMDQLEAAGIVGPASGGKARSVLVDAMQLGSLIKTSNFDE
jgi:S-DNA-T family DNA segregation ATPase FtsK/SpoIIIE